MGLLGHLKRDKAITGSTDVTGFSLLDADIYDMIIELAFLKESKSGAMGIEFRFTSPEGKHRETVYVTSGDAKGKLPYFVDKQSGEKRYLPGFIIASDIARLSVDKELDELETEEKVVEIYNPELQKEAPTKVQCLTELMGQPISLGILKVLEDAYPDVTESREKNEIAKVFHTESKLTVAEAEAELEEGEFATKWLDINKGKVKDKRKQSKEGASTPMGKSPTSQATAPKKSLFG